MKATRILFASSVLLLLGACTDPPFGHPGYPRGSSSLRYPPSYTHPQGRNYNDPNNSQENRWERPPGYVPPGDPGYSQPRPRDEFEPEPEPEPRRPEDNPLVEDFDPLEEPDEPKYEYAIPVQGASNLVVSPYAKEGPYIDVSGLSSGTQIECPKTKKTILVP